MRFIAAAALASLALLADAQAAEKPAPALEKPEIRDLGGGKYQIGAIVLDKEAKTFSVPGKVLRLDPPIEFLAVSKGGQRGYESYLELDADAIQFNLACILIGMEENKGVRPKFHFDPAPLQGSTAEMLLSWEADGKTFEVAVTELFKAGDKDAAANEWVYTGSHFAPDGKYYAEMSGGTLVGLIHDPDSIIEHRAGFGQASYGHLKPDPALSPPLNTKVRLTVKRKD